jgi:enterochelin esterase family protein
VTNLVARAQEGTPIIVDGEKAAFIWQGQRAPKLIGDFTDWEHGSPITLRQDAPGVWSHSLDLPGDAYIEYAFWQDGERVADPLNPRTSPDGFGHDNHYFYMPNAAPTTLIQRRRGVAHGTLARHVIEEEFMLANNKRTIYLYQPPTPEPVPLVVALDGQDYRRRARLADIVDNLVATGRIKPVALALVYHGRTARGVEYACSEATLGFLIHRVLPLAQTELNLLNVRTRPGAFGVLGASMGGLMALFAGLRAPGIFGNVLSQSGAFSDDYESVVFDLVRHGPVRPLRLWLDAGRYEWLLEGNRSIYKLLAERGYDVAFREFNGGHNYPAWRNDLPHGLEHLFGPSRSTEVGE